jgi:hypothetical protein
MRRLALRLAAVRLRQLDEDVRVHGPRTVKTSAARSEATTVMRSMKIPE